MIHNGNKIKSFKESEFREDPHKYADPMLMLKLQRQRDLLGCEIWPSDAKGTLARLEHMTMCVSDYRFEFVKEPSMHNVFLDKKSTAVDVFCNCDPFRAFVIIARSGLWPGVGVYFDTRDNKGLPRVMFHLDFGRKEPLMWIRKVGKYMYQAEPGFWGALKGPLAMREF